MLGISSHAYTCQQSVEYQRNPLQILQFSLFFFFLVGSLLLVIYLIALILPEPALNRSVWRLLSWMPHTHWPGSYRRGTKTISGFTSFALCHPGMTVLHWLMCSNQGFTHFISCCQCSWPFLYDSYFIISTLATSRCCLLALGSGERLCGILPRV